MKLWIAITAVIVAGVTALALQRHSQLTVVKSIDLNRNTSVVVEQDRVWYHESPQLVSIDLARPNLEPEAVGDLDVEGYANVAAVDGKTLLLSHSSGINVYSLRDPLPPALISTFTPPGNRPGTFAFRNGLVVTDGYVADSQVLHIYDLSSLEQPELKATIAMSRGANIHDIAVSNRLILVANGYAGLTILKQANGEGFQHVGKLAFPAHVRGVVAIGDRAYIAASAAPGMNSQFTIVDISDPALPRVIASVETPGGAQDVFMRANRAFVADRDQGIMTIDVSDEVHPRVIDRYKPSDGRIMNIYGSEDYLVFPLEVGARLRSLQLARLDAD